MIRPRKETGIAVVANCRRCAAEKPRSISMERYSQLSVGVTHEGTVRVWCVRHDVLVGDLTPDTVAQLLRSGCACCAGHAPRGLGAAND